MDMHGEYREFLPTAMLKKASKNSPKQQPDSEMVANSSEAQRFENAAAAVLNQGSTSGEENERIESKNAEEPNPEVGNSCQESIPEMTSTYLDPDAQRFENTSTAVLNQGDSSTIGEKHESIECKNKPNPEVGKINMEMNDICFSCGFGCLLVVGKNKKKMKPSEKNPKSVVDNKTTVKKSTDVKKPAAEKVNEKNTGKVTVKEKTGANSDKRTKYKMPKSVKLEVLFK